MPVCAIGPPPSTNAPLRPVALPLWWAPWALPYILALLVPFLPFLSLAAGLPLSCDCPGSAVIAAVTPPCSHPSPRLGSSPPPLWLQVPREAWGMDL